MNAAILPAQVKCPGCEREFTPRGLSQHVSRIDNIRCRRVVVTPHSYLPSTAFPSMASLPTLTSNRASQIVGETGEVALGNSGEYDEPTQGEFTVTHVAAHAAI